MTTPAVDKSGDENQRPASSTNATTSSIDKNTKKDRAKARWSILRNALLQKSQAETTEESAYSIHRFPGYQLLRPLSRAEMHLSRIESNLKVFHFDKQASMSTNLERIEIAVLALCAAYPKACCLKVILDDATTLDQSPDSWIQTLQAACRPTVNVLVIEKNEKESSVVLMVQEARATTRYHCCEYALDETCSLWTREPKETKLSIQDLVSHRRTGVDNTGNICVWDSERTLAYLLYHFDLEELAPHVGGGNIHDSYDRSLQILELGTGMAGLAAIALGLRIVKKQQQREGTTVVRPKITLTDGHADGVKNNLVNKYLTSLYKSSFSTDNNNRDSHPYNQLDVSCHVLLWTTDLSLKNGYQSSDNSLEEQQDIVLVSDCVHFQNFHAALVVTTLRALRVGGRAIFCQPTRGDSLDNFCKLLRQAINSSTPEDGDKTSSLLSMEWLDHSVIQEQHELATKEHESTYDPNLHRPKVLLVTKLRSLTERDCQVLIAHQQGRVKEAS